MARRLPVPHRSAAAPLAAALLAGSLVLLAGAGVALAQGGAQQRPVFCIGNQVNGNIVAEIRAGAASTKVPLAPRQEGCCVRFCAEHPAPAGYQIAIMAQPPGGISHELCHAVVKQGQLLDVIGTLIEGQCSTRALP